MPEAFAKALGPQSDEVGYRGFVQSLESDTWCAMQVTLTALEADPVGPAYIGGAAD